jgi:putative peptidoglycan lipid II flippase
MTKTNKIVGATLLLMGVAFASKIIGFIRVQFIGYYFGTSHEADAFIMAFTIPTLLLTISGGAISAALIPMIIRLRNQGETIRLKSLIGSMFSMTTLIMLGVTVVFYLFLEPFTSIYAGGKSAQEQEAVLHMLKIIVPAFIAIGLISLFTSILNAYKHYFIPSLGPIFYSAGIIIAIVFFSEKYGIQSLMVGMAIGIMLHLLFAITAIFAKKISLTPKIIWNEDMRKVGILIVPFIISIGAFQLNTVVDRMMAFSLEEGSVVALNMGFTVNQLPLSIFVGAMVLPLFPMIADKLSKQDLVGTKELLSRSYRLLGILLLPVTGAFIFLAEPIIKILFLRGAFDLESVEMTSTALIFYSFTLLPFAMRDVITRAFYSLQDTWTPVINSLILVALNITLMLILVPKFGIMGVAGSTSIASIFAYIRIRRKLIQKIGHQHAPQDSKTWWLIWRNAVIFTLLTWGVYQGLLVIWQEPTGVQLWVRTLVSFAIGGLTYSILTLRLKTSEVEWLVLRMKRLVRAKV